MSSVNFTNKKAEQMQIIQDKSGFFIKYTEQNAIKTEPITPDAIKVLRWYWKNVPVND